jgi:hypothetical protein
MLVLSYFRVSAGEKLEMGREEDEQDEGQDTQAF